jgi:hypothetical protein
MDDAERDEEPTCDHLTIGVPFRCPKCGRVVGGYNKCTLFQRAGERWDPWMDLLERQLLERTDLEAD